MYVVVHGMERDSHAVCRLPSLQENPIPPFPSDCRSVIGDLWADGALGWGSRRRLAFVEEMNRDRELVLDGIPLGNKLAVSLVHRKVGDLERYGFVRLSGKENVLEVRVGRLHALLKRTHEAVSRLEALFDF